MTKFKYILYARKSSEDKNRQVTSIDDQIKELTRIAKTLNLEIVEIISESKSAKKPGREGFNKMLEKIHKEEADGILCWKLDRLARNPLDHGNLGWMLEQGLIQRIRTHSNEYKPTDNVLMMQVEFGMATQYIKDLRVNVSRGTRLKAERGWFPSPILPFGYKHNPLYLARESNVEIIPDPKTYMKVKQLWDMLLTKAFSVSDLKRHADAIGLRSKKGNSIALNTYHQLFKKQFYCGRFQWKDAYGVKRNYEGKHEKMITSSQFDLAQRILGNFHQPTRLRERKYTFPFRGFIFCGECSGYVTAEFIHQVICTRCKYKYSVKTDTKCRKCKMDFEEMIDPTEIKKKYYRCSKKKFRKCTQKSIEENDILKCAEQFSEKMSIQDDFYVWAKEEIESQTENINESNKLIELERREKELVKRNKGLISMRIDGEIETAQFKELKQEINSQLQKIKNELFNFRDHTNELRRKALRHLGLARNADSAYKSADLDGKKRIVREIGYNLVLKDKKIRILTPKWIVYLEDFIDNYKDKKPWVQPTNNAVKLRSIAGLNTLQLDLLAVDDLI